MTATYQGRLAAVTEARGSLCVGIDPHASVLEAWRLPANAVGLEKCARAVVEAVGDKVAVFKPQSAFFERFGAAGIAVLERVLADIRAAGALSILDVKRGDIGSTMAGYAAAYLADDAPLRADAITVSPYLGFGSLMPAFDQAHDTGRGVYVLARTSNPEGAEIQLAMGEDSSVAQRIIDESARLNRRSGQGAIGLVVGGTHDSIGCDLSGFNGSILVPGIGFQGGRIDDLPRLFGDALDRVLPVVSRGVLAAGPSVFALTAKVEQFLGV
ncbi:orotidine-5'-phosphate decarboxylase [Propionicicella superfundia]|uniref:orotidine-5'-phosphate decarboxylase n=1 Tax=Propionicicella superfundia TaxID=348582 RepID=UPI00041E10D9|nr:orotidine-5'-phosphate decarboxylase [Propionicicella superfundia]